MPISARALAALSLLLPGTAPAATWTVPGLSNAPGRNGTFFVSELKLRNGGSGTATVTFELLALVGAPGSPVARSIEAGETLLLPNVLSELWGAGDRAGALRLTSPGALVVSARTYNAADAAGTFGLSVEPVPDERLLSPGETGHVGWVSESADPRTGFRTNVGVVLPVAGSAVDAVVFRGDGVELGRRTFSGGPAAFQVSVAEIASGDLSAARLELRATAGRSTGYAAVVDNVTGDGFTSQPLRLVPGSWTDVTLDGAARSRGRFGTYFRTDVRLVNPGAAARRVTVAGLALAASGSPFPATATVDVPALSVREMTDVLGGLLGAPDGTSGSLRFTTDGPLLVLGRTSNVRSDGATFGASQSTFSASDYLLPGRVGTFVGLLDTSSTPGFRTNVGFLAGLAGAVVDLTLRDRSGAVVATRSPALTLPSLGYTQPSLSTLFDGTAIPDQATLEVRVTAGTVDAYASFIDNGTGDSAIFTPDRSPEAALPNLSASSPCPASPGAAGLVNDGTGLFRVTIDAREHPDALCNDGSPGVFYVRKGTGAGASRWVLFLEGGGACSDAASCQERWCSIGTNFGAAKMSNRYAPAKGIGGGGILSERPDNAFASFNQAWVYYCSSDTWSGQARDRVLVDDATGRAYSIHFLGSRILDAVVTELRRGVTYRDASEAAVTMPSLDDAEAVLFVGESAGSAGVLRHADRLGAYLAATNRTGRLAYRALLDAANTPSYEAWPAYEAETAGRLAVAVARFSGRVDESCVALHPADAWRCGDPAHVRGHHLTTPFFARQDLLDSNVLSDFGTPQWPYGTTLSAFAQAVWDHMDSLRRIRTTAEERDAMTVDPGVYVPQCGEHTALRNNGKFFQGLVAAPGGGVTYHDTFRSWLLGADPRSASEPRPTGDPVPSSLFCSP